MFVEIMYANTFDSDAVYHHDFLKFRESLLAGDSIFGQSKSVFGPVRAL